MEQKRLVRNILRLYEGYSLSMLQVGTRRQTRSIVSIVVLSFLIHNICGCDSRAKSTPPDVKPQENKNRVDGGEKDVELTSIEPDDWFEDVTSQTGLRFQYRSGRESELRTILETVGGGIAVLDFDGDQRADLFCVGGGTLDPATGVPSGVPCGLFRNLGETRFSDVSSVSEIDAAIDYSHGCVCGDINSDGFEDAFVTCFGLNSLFLNQGDGTFLRSNRKADFGVPRWNTAAALADIDRDGELDVYVTGYVNWVPSGEKHPDVPGPQSYEPVSDEVFLNSGDGEFTCISRLAGIREDRMGLGVIATDLNNDNRIDFYIANDVVANHLYPGGGGIQFRESAELNGLAYNEAGNPEGSMGVDCEDENGDGRDDLWVTSCKKSEARAWTW